MLLSNNLLDLFLQVLEPNQLEDILENMVYTLANMLAYHELKDQIRNHKFFESIIHAVEDQKIKQFRSLDFSRVLSWFYSNALFEPYPEINQGFKLMHYMSHIFYRYPDDNEIANECIWGLLKFLQVERVSVERKKLVHDKNIMKHVAKRIIWSDEKFQRIALQALETFCFENKNKEHFDSFLDDMDSIDVAKDSPGAV